MKSPTDVVSGFILLGLCGVGAYSVATLPDAGGMEHVGPGAFPAGILVLLTALPDRFRQTMRAGFCSCKTV